VQAVTIYQEVLERAPQSLKKLQERLSDLDSQIELYLSRWAREGISSQSFWDVAQQFPVLLRERQHVREVIRHYQRVTTLLKPKQAKDFLESLAFIADYELELNSPLDSIGGFSHDCDAV